MHKEQLPIARLKSQDSETISKIIAAAILWISDETLSVLPTHKIDLRNQQSLFLLMLRTVLRLFVFDPSHPGHPMIFLDREDQELRVREKDFVLSIRVSSVEFQIDRQFNDRGDREISGGSKDIDGSVANQVNALLTTSPNGLSFLEHLAVTFSERIFSVTFFYLEPDDFKFWKKLFIEILTAKFSTSRLYIAVASFPEHDWHQGPTHIAEKIREIEAEFLAEKSQLAETLEYDLETDKIHVRHIPVQEPAHTDALLDNVEDALEVACLKGNTNPNEGVYASLRVMLEKRRDKPQSIEITCSRVATDLVQMIKAGDLPDDSNQNGLLSAVRELALGIRAAHPDIAEHRKRLADQVVDELDNDEKDTLQKFEAVVAEVGSDELKEDSHVDVLALTANRGFVPIGGAPKPRPADAAARIAHRNLQLQTMSERFKEDSPEFFDEIAEGWDSPKGKTTRAVVFASRTFAEVTYIMMRILGHV